MDLTPQQCAALLDEARRVIRSRLGVGGTPAADPAAADAPPDRPADPALLQPAGCFVTLHTLQSHRLRGCVGRLEASGPLWDTVRAVAGNVLHDPRFLDEPVTAGELADLEIEISVLSPLRPAPGPLEFDPERDGIYLTLGERAGCFLPQVARETGWGRQQLLDRLCVEKMGLPPGEWRDPKAKLLLFSTLMIGPEPFVTTGSKIQGTQATTGALSQFPPSPI